MDNLPATTLPSEVEALLASAVNDNIEVLEQHSLKYPQLEISAKESFVNGMYTREILIPADSIITGRVWQHPYVDIMISGDITVATPDGLKRMTGYNQLRGMNGRKRAGYAHEDTRWITVHRTDLEDPGCMVEQLTFFSMNEYRSWRDRVDFHVMLRDLGVSPEQAWEQSAAEDDRIDLDLELLDLELKPSTINGIGLYSTKLVEPETLVCPARIDGDRTQAGRYVNHSAAPNCAMRWVGENIGMVSIEQIDAGDELTCDYRHPELLIVNVEEA